MAASDTPTDSGLQRQLGLLEEIQKAYRGAAEPASWGPLRITGRLGAGGFGDVYRARDPVLERDVALKLARHGLGADAERRYIDEARRLARVKHPNVVMVHGADVHEGRAGLWTDLVEGATLEEVLETSGPFGAREAALVGLDLCRALSAVHAQGLVHGDVKTSNVMRERGGRIVLMDFGTVKEMAPDGDAVMTRGTPVALAPELLRGEPLTPAADVYSLGVLLYRLVSGRYPVDAETALDAAAQHARGGTAPLRDLRPDLPEPFLQAVERCLRAEPQDRYQTSGEVSAPLRDTLGLGPQAAGVRGGTPRRGRLAWTIAATALVAGGALAVLALRGALGRAPTLPRFERLTFRAGAMPFARFTADGQTVVFTAAPAGGPFELFLARPGSPESRTLGLTDARLVALSRRDEMAYIRTRGHFPTSTGTLSRALLAGGGSRDVMDGVRDADWSPDGSELAVSRAQGNVNVLEFPIGRRLHEAPAIWSLRVSRDGQRVAFMRGAFALTSVGDLMVVDRAGRATTLIERSRGALGLAWSPDDKEVWFGTPPSAETGEIKAVSMGGRQRTLARVPGPVSVLDVLEDGRALVAPVDTRGGLVCARAGQDERDLSWLENNWGQDLSADGSRVLVYESFLAGGRRGGVYVLPTDGSPAVRVGDGRPEALSPDGRWVLAMTANDGGDWVLLPTGAGAARVLDHGSVRTIVEADWLGDGSAVVVSGREDNGRTRVYLLDVASGRLQWLLDDVTLASNAVTLDGRHFLGSAQGRWSLYGLDGGQPRPVPHLQQDDTPLQWSPDGRWVFVRRGGYNDGPPVIIEKIEVSSGRRVPWRTLMPRDPVGIMRVHPVLLQADGSAFCYHYTRAHAEIYLASGLR